MHFSSLDKQGLQFYPVHIKLDTGMHRLGFGTNEIEELINLIKKVKTVYGKIRLQLLWWQAKIPGEDVFTDLQY